MAQTLMILDGNSIINRAYYGIRPLSTKDGVPTNAIYGFLNILLKYIDELSPAYLCAAFDLPAPTFRHRRFADYKAQRKGMPDELAAQLPLLKEVLSAMRIPMLELAGYEADDIIGTVSRLCEAQSVSCAIITGDKDDLQLASDLTKIYLTTTSQGLTRTQVYDRAAVVEKYGVTPQEFIDVKALMGDSSDNIPGVAGIGEKTALSLIEKNKSIEAIYRDLAACGAKGAVLTRLENGRDSAFLSKELATIDRHVPLSFSLEDALRAEPDADRLSALFGRLEFQSFIKKLSLPQSVCDSGAAASLPPIKSMQLAADAAQLSAFCARARQEQALSYRLYWDEGHILAIAAVAADEALYAPTGLFLSEDAILQAFGPLFADTSIKKVGHNVKDDIVQLHHLGVTYTGLDFDTAIAAYILDPSRTDYPIDALAASMLALTLTSGQELLGKGRSACRITDIDEQAAMRFAIDEVRAVLALRSYMEAQLEVYGQSELYRKIELPLVSALADMQIAGVAVNREKLGAFNAMLADRLDVLTAEITELVGYSFNINSTRQLSEALFGKLGLHPVKKTKTGYSTDSAVLEKLRGVHPVIELLIEYRLVSKIKSTYGDGLLSVIDARTGRIHSSFNQTVTVTGRISSTEPNLQNIPVRHPLGREIRRMFVAGGEDMFLIDADYSQIELRILAHVAHDDNMKAAFAEGVDIHTMTASQVLHIQPDQVTAEERGRAKAVNFGIVYGIGEFSLAQDLKISVAEARRYIEGYLANYPGVKRYMDDIKQQAERDGYVTTLFGRRRYIPELKSSNHNLRAFGQRVALNTPIQGSAADIIKLAMVRVHQRLQKEQLRSRLILQVHDELIVEAPADELAHVCEILKYEMEHAADLDVALVVEEKYGKSWYDTK